ncbi:uncharacterized protein LOC143055295 [Mytilus galloprovincialis]|uniref:uncharacterized protein LOC143055295 n=1 Tax=Mytilus galloprovincialis TaxID=29158 RepID=UPI003F7CC051
MKEYLILKLVLLLLDISSVKGLRCFSCYDIIHPRFCDRIDTCSHDEVCGIDKIIKPHETTFNIGCVKASTCSTTRTLSDVEACRTCCNTDLCNVNGCGEHGFGSQHGKVCFNCQGITDINECKYVAFCEENEVCFIDRQRIAAESYYTLGCRNRHVCQPDTGIGSIFGRSAENKIMSRSLQCTRCCDNNLCNDHCGNITDNSQTTQKNLKQTHVTSTTTTTTGRPTETTTELCNDHSNCDYLVQHLGICNDSYGLQMCPVACGKCIIPTTYSCIDTDTECSYLRDTYNICAVPDTARKTGCLKTCNYCDYDLCKDNHPCNNGGICNKTDDWFTCHCNIGFGGELCNEKIQTDTKGNEFYLGFLTSFNQNGKLYLYIVSSTDGTCQIFIPYLSVNSSFAISNTSINSYDFSPTVFMNQLGIQIKAIHVKCDIPVSMYGLTFTGTEVDGFLALPSKLLGNKYIVSSFTPWTRYIPHSNSNFGIIGIDQSTNVTIDFRIAGGSVTYNNIQYGNNDTLRVHLSQFDTFYLSSHYDFSGTLVAASSPVAVMSGVRTSYLRNGWGNHMEEMILPNEQLGRDFIVPKLYDSQCNFRIFAPEHSRVRINNNSLIQYIDIQRGRFQEFENYDIYTVQSSSPIQVQLYCNGASSSSDAFMATLPSVQHFKSSYKYPVVNNFRYSSTPQHFYITVIIQSNAIMGLRLDDKDILKYEMISNITLGSTLYSIITVEQRVGLHEIKQHKDIPFGLIVYGRNHESGYGFPAGFATKIKP